MGFFILLQNEFEILTAVDDNTYTFTVATDTATTDTVLGIKVLTGGGWRKHFGKIVGLQM